MPEPEGMDTTAAEKTRIVLPGGAGLVGQNLVVRLKARGYRHITVLDKHESNLASLAALHPDVIAEHVDLSQPGSWQQHIRDADVLIMLQAQIGGLNPQDFENNNVSATRLILDAIDRDRPPYLVHISSSVVESVADDFYSRSKRAQEQLVLASGLACPVLRPTLMFGWFDRKHFGWLSRFMKRVPVFPVPGLGHYSRQPLYVGDFCDIILSCVESRRAAGVYNISGQEHLDYVEMIREIRSVTGAHSMIVHIPYFLFHFLLRVWSWFDGDPPFTTQQLEALVADDDFEVIDWPTIFQVQATPFTQALDETFNHPAYSKVILEF
ncbi:MAG: NAD-dependent epimerase/dehydratase family protein [Halioglobus sp.]